MANKLEKINRKQERSLEKMCMEICEKQGGSFVVVCTGDIGVYKNYNAVQAYEKVEDAAQRMRKENADPKQDEVYSVFNRQGQRLWP